MEKKKKAKSLQETVLLLNIHWCLIYNDETKPKAYVNYT